MEPERFSFHSEYFDLIMGTDRVRQALEAGQPVERIVESFGQGLDEFTRLRQPFLLYD